MIVATSGTSIRWPGGPPGQWNTSPGPRSSRSPCSQCSTRLPSSTRPQCGRSHHDSAYPLWRPNVEPREQPVAHDRPTRSSIRPLAADRERRPTTRIDVGRGGGVPTLRRTSIPRARSASGDSSGGSVTGAKPATVAAALGPESVHGPRAPRRTPCPPRASAIAGRAARARRRARVPQCSWRHASSTGVPAVPAAGRSANTKAPSPMSAYRVTMPEARTAFRSRGATRMPDSLSRDPTPVARSVGSA